MSEAIINKKMYKSKLSKKAKLSKEEKEVLSMLESLNKLIKLNENMYDILDNEDLIDSNIYELKAMEMKYKYYLNEAKRLGLIHNLLSDVKSTASNGKA